MPVRRISPRIWQLTGGFCRQIWQLRRDLLAFPVSSASYQITLRYMTRGAARGGAVLLFTAVRRETPGPHRTRQRCSSPVCDRPSATRPVSSRQNRLQRRLEAVLTRRNGPGRAQTVANRAGTALTGAVKTRTERDGRSEFNTVSSSDSLPSTRAVPPIVLLSFPVCSNSAGFNSGLAQFSTFILWRGLCSGTGSNFIALRAYFPTAHSTVVWYVVF